MDRYEEALSRARKLYNEAKANEYTSDMEDYEFIFPELKESEDERIRKELIKVYDDIRVRYGGNTEWQEGITYDMILSWFEKQGEMMKALQISNSRIAELVEEKYNLEEKLKKQGEQKPVWSEEDENAFSDALWCCKQAASIAKDENDMGNVWYAENWLKSLRHQTTWKPSDEQIKALKTACDEHWEPDGLDPLYTLYQDLKKLKG